MVGNGYVKNFHHTRLPISGSRLNSNPISAQKCCFFLKKYPNKLQTSLTRPKCILTDLRGYRVPFLTISTQNILTQWRWAANFMPKNSFFAHKKITVQCDTIDITSAWSKKVPSGLNVISRKLRLKFWKFYFCTETPRALRTFLHESVL